MSVFLRVGQQADLTRKGSKQLIESMQGARAKSLSKIEQGNETIDIVKGEERSPMKLFMMHMVALLKKRWHSSKASITFI